MHLAVSLSSLHPLEQAILWLHPSNKSCKMRKDLDKTGQGIKVTEETDIYPGIKMQEMVRSNIDFCV